MWSNIGFAKMINFNDIKIGEKITKYFTSQQISEYYVSDSPKQK